VEPFLDLSLPIVDEHSKLASDTNEWDKNTGAKFKKDYKRSSFLTGKKGKKVEENKDDVGEILDPKENVLSKHQTKKQKKLQIKKGKVCDFSNDKYFVLTKLKKNIIQIEYFRKNPKLIQSRMQTRKRKILKYANKRQRIWRMPKKMFKRQTMEI